MKFPIFINLMKLPYLLVALAVSLVFFNLNYSLMAKLPGAVNNMCVLGGGLNSSNISFAILMSLLLGIFSAGFYALLKQGGLKKNKALTAASGTTGFILGPLTVFCTLCTLPAISLFGLSTILNFFYDYNAVIKTISIAIMILGLISLNRQLAKQCDRCVY